MKEKSFYLIGGLIVYAIFGFIISCLINTTVNLKFIVFWTIGMTLADFFILRNLKKWILKKQRKQHV